MRKSLYLMACLALFSLTAVAQNGRVGMYAIGFYNLENLFDTQHDANKNDYEYLHAGTHKWTEMK